MHELTICLILAAAAFCQWLAWRVRLPGIVFLLLAGIGLGPLFQLLDPQELMGDLLFPFVSLSVALILFEGSLTLKFREIRGLERVVRNLVSFGMVITWLITAAAAWFFIGVSWQIALLLGAITSVSGPTVIMPMLRTVRPARAVSNILRWEGILIDPIGASAAVLVYEFIISGAGQEAAGHTLFTFAKLTLTGAAAGVLAGQGLGTAIRRLWIPQYLQTLTAMAIVICAFALSNALVPESGLVTVTVMGIWMANMADVALKDILDFKENISMVLISVLFVLLAARLDIQALLGLGWGTVGLFVAVQFLARPLNAMASCLGSDLPWPQRHLLAWIAPRGIVAAAIAALFSVQLEAAGMAGAHLLVPLTFFIIIATVVFQSLTARHLALWLKAAQPEPTGFLIIGANAVARALGAALAEQGIAVLLADSGWTNASRARSQGIPVYFGNPVSEHASQHMDLSGIGHVLALSPHENINAAAAMHFKADMGQEAVFVIRTKAGEENLGTRRLLASHPGTLLFDPETTFGMLASRLDAGATLHTTDLTETFDYADFSDKKLGLPLFALSPQGRAQPFTEKRQPKPMPGWSVLYLADPDKNKPS